MATYDMDFHKKVDAIRRNEAIFKEYMERAATLIMGRDSVGSTKAMLQIPIFDLYYVNKLFELITRVWGVSVEYVLLENSPKFQVIFSWKPKQVEAA